MIIWPIYDKASLVQVVKCHVGRLLKNGICEFIIHNICKIKNKTKMTLNNWQELLKKVNYDVRFKKKIFLNFFSIINLIFVKKNIIH